MTFYVACPLGVIPCRCLGTARLLARELGGVVCGYDPRCVLVPPDDDEMGAAALAVAA